MRSRVQPTRQWLEQVEQAVRQCFPELAGRAEMPGLDALLQFGEQGSRCCHADIRREQNGLQLFVHFIVYLAAAPEQISQLVAGARQAITQTLQPVG